MIPYGGMLPEETPAEHRNRIMHARLVVGNQVLMGGDAHPGQPYEGVKGCSVAIQADTPDQAERLFSC